LIAESVGLAAPVPALIYSTGERPQQLVYEEVEAGRFGDFNCLLVFNWVFAE
jgi:hypothetical protein